MTGSILKKNLSPRTTFIVLAIVLIVIALLYNYFSMGGLRGRAYRLQREAERRIPTVDPDTGKLIVIQLPPHGAVKGAALPENRKYSKIYIPKSQRTREKPEKWRPWKSSDEEGAEKKK